MDCDWMGLKHDHEIHGQFESIIPQDNKYQMSYFKKLPNARNGNSAEVNSSSQSTLSTEINFHAKFDVNICDPKCGYKWLEQFSSITTTSWNHGAWRKDTDDPHGKKVIFFARRKCHHAVAKFLNAKTNQLKADKTKGKNQECPSSIKITIHKHKESDEYPMSVDLWYQHSHPVEAASAYKMHPVSEETKLKFLELFATGVSASTAYHTHRANLREQNPDNFARILCDRSVSPDFPWVCNFHQKYTLEKFGSIDGPDAMLRAIQHAEKYNQENPTGEEGRNMVVVKQRPDGHFIITICDALARRVHEVSINIRYRVSHKTVCTFFVSFTVN